MHSIVRNNVKVIAAVVITAVLVGGGPTIAAMVFDAQNANKVDGLHAKKFSKKAKARRNKLVAANKKGYLPNNIIRMAPNAKKLGGQAASLYALKTDLTNYYTKEEADAAYIQQAGDVVVSSAPASWVTPLTVVPIVGVIDPAVTYTATTASYTVNGAGSKTFNLHPEVPVALYGKRMLFEGVELCYSSGGGVTIDSATANVVSQDGAGAASSAPQALLSSASDDNCVYTEFVSPSTLDIGDGVNVQLVATWVTPTAPLGLGRVTFVFEPTETAVTTPTT